MGELKLVSEIYELSQHLNRAGKQICITKVVCFFILDAIAIIYPNLMTNWPALHNGLIYSGIAYTVILGISFLLGLLQPSQSIREYNWQFTAALLFLLDYAVLPVKTLLLLPLLGSPNYLTIAMAADWLITLVMVQFLIVFLRDFKPTKHKFFSVLVSPCELLLTFLVSVRTVFCSFMNSSAGGLLGIIIRILAVLLVGGCVLWFMLFRRPFFDGTAEKLFSSGILINTLLVASYIVLGSLESSLKFLIISGPLCLVSLFAYLSVPILPNFFPNKNDQFWEIKSLLLGNTPDLNSVTSRGQLRVHLLTHKKFGLVFANQVKTSIRLTTTMGSFNAFKTFTQHKVSDTREEAKPKMNNTASLSPNHPGYQPTPSVFSRKGDEEISRRDYSLASPTALSPTVLSPTLTMQPISDRSRKPAGDSQKPADNILNEMIIENYLGGDQSGYPSYLYLMWVIDHKVTLGKLMSILAMLKNTQRRFRSTYYYFAAKREIEKKLTELVTNNRETIRYISKTNNSNKGALNKGKVEKTSKKTSEAGGPDLQKELAEQVDISEAFYMKSQLIILSKKIREYSKANIEYVDSLTLTNQDLYYRSSMVQRLFKLNREIEILYQDIDDVSTEQNFQHSVLFFYHSHLNSNKHHTAGVVRSEINKRFKSMKTVLLKYIKKVSNLNYLNECVLLMIESQRSKFGTILDIYGKTEMFLDDPLELVGASYTLFMNNSLKTYHQQLESMIFEDTMDRPDAFNFVLSRPGFVKVPFRSIILPSMVMVRICPFEKSGFKFIAAIKPDFSDDKLYIALNTELGVDGYSSSFLSILNEEYLKFDVGLQTMSVHVQNRISNYHQLDADQSRSKVDKGKNTRKKVSTRSPIRQHLDNRTANFFIEDARSARSVLNSAQNSGGRSDNPTNSDMTRDIVLDERLHFFHVENEDIEPEVRSFKILLKYHNYPSKSQVSQQPKGYWYLCLTLSSEAGVFIDLPMATPSENNDHDGSLTHSKVDNKVNNASEGRFA